MASSGGYVRNGEVRPRKHETPVSMGYIMDGAWSFLNTIGFFFQTLISQEASDAFVANGGRPGGSRARAGTVGGGGAAAPTTRRGVHGMNTVRGMSHNAAVGGG